MRKIDRKSWLIGFVLRLVCAANPCPSGGSKREPVAYLYNGVRLPGLPEWDRETYPYAVIVYIDGRYCLWLMASALIIGSDEGITIQQYTCTDNAWAEDSQMSFTPSGHDPSYWDCLIWSNHDVWTIDSNTVNIY